MLSVSELFNYIKQKCLNFQDTELMKSSAICATEVNKGDYVMTHHENRTGPIVLLLGQQSNNHWNLLIKMCI